MNGRLLAGVPPPAPESGDLSWGGPRAMGAPSGGVRHGVGRRRVGGLAGGCGGGGIGRGLL